VTVPRAIGVTSLTGGGVGSLDSEHVKDSSGNIAINDGDPALAFVQGDAVYNYIADADSGLAESSPDVIKPDWESVGVAYTGALRWILHEIKPATSLDDGTNTGDIIRWNAVSEAWESSAEPLDFTQINLTPQAAAVANTEGGVYYKSSDKKVYVCTEDS